MELPTTLRAQIVALVESGITQTAVSLQYNTSRQNVSRTMQRYRATNSFTSRTRSGRPSITSPPTDRVMRRLVVASPSISSRAVT